MKNTVNYYFTPQSPWCYLGHERFVAMARARQSALRVQPIDLGRVFPVSGGLPLPKRAPQRQAYRLIEIKRFAAYLGMPVHAQPKFFPVSGDAAARLIIAVDLHDGTDKALQLTGAIMAACWAQERNIASEVTLLEILEALALPAARIAQAHTQDVQERYDTYTQEAIDAGVFGVPSFVIDGEMFWGQDRLDFVQRKLSVEGN